MREASDAQMLVLTVNGEPRSVQNPCTVQALLDRLEVGAKRVAVAVNRDVVPRSTFPSRELTHGDRVEILEAVGGGA
jgi:sulfur carrier protein